MQPLDVYYLKKPEWTAGSKSNTIRLTDDCCFVVRGIEYWIPADYECDGASIPRAFWWIPGIGAPHNGWNAYGAIPHDTLYLTHALPRDIVDEVAFQLWRQAGKPLWAARTMWAAVRSPAGAMAWHNDSDDMEALSITRRLIGYREPSERPKFDALWYAKEEY